MKRRLLAMLLTLTMTIGAMPFAAVTTATADTISPLDDDKFTILWASDPQWYSFAYPEIIDAQNRWVVDNYARMDMRYIVHTGDFVDNPHNHTQWAVMDAAYKLWDEAGLAYGVLAGNHDVDGSDHTEFSQYFGKARYQNNPWYGGDYDNNFGHYDLMTIEGVDFLFVYLGYNHAYTDADIAWLNSVLQAYPNRIAMLSFHDYLTATGMRSANGENIFQNVVLKNPNVRTVFCGHNYNAARRVENIDDNGDGVADRTVYQMMANYQNTTNGGNGFMRFMEFDVADGTVTHRTYSPYTASFGSDYEDGTVIDEYGTRDSFTLPFDFSAPAAKGQNDPEKGSVVVTRELTFAQTASASSMVVPITYQNEAADGNTFEGLGIYDRHFSLNAADAFTNPASLHFVTATYNTDSGYTVTAVTKGSTLSGTDPFVAIPQNGIVVVIASDAQTKGGVAVDINKITVGQTIILKNADGITTPTALKNTTLTTPWGTVYSVNGANRMTGNDHWVIYDNAETLANYDHSWNMLFAFTPASGQSFTLTDAATTLGTAKTLSIPQNGFVLAINTYSGEDTLRSSLKEYFKAGLSVMLNGYTVGQIPTYNAQSILPPSSLGWAGDSSLVGTYQDGNAQVIYKKGGDWPAADYDLPTPITFDPTETALVYDFFMETGCKDNIILFFKNSNSASSTSAEYISIQSYFEGVVISSGSGDIKGDDLDHSGKIDLSKVAFPSTCYNDDGVTLTLNGIRILSAGEVDKKLFLRQLTLTDELDAVDNSVAQSIPLLAPSAITVADPTKQGGYTYDNGKLTVTADTDNGIELRVALNKAVNINVLKKLLVNADASVRFDIKADVTTAGADASYGLVSDFYPAMNVTLDNGMIPAGSYDAVLDLYSCYEWNNVIPADGISTVKAMVITLGGKGTLTIDALQLSNITDEGHFADGVTVSAGTVLDDILTATVGTSVTELLSAVSAYGTLSVVDKAGNAVTSGNVATGMTVILSVNGTAIDEATVSVRGDVNGNGDIDTVDAREVLLQVLGVSSVTPAQQLAADFDQSGDIMSSDARAILLEVVNE